jgi:hypothetical protein
MENVHFIIVQYLHTAPGLRESFSIQMLPRQSFFREHCTPAPCAYLKRLTTREGEREGERERERERMSTLTKEPSRPSRSSVWQPSGIVNMIFLDRLLRVVISMSHEQQLITLPQRFHCTRSLVEEQHRLDRSLPLHQNFLFHCRACAKHVHWQYAGVWYQRRCSQRHSFAFADVASCFAYCVSFLRPFWLCSRHLQHVSADLAETKLHSLPDEATRRLAAARDLLFCDAARDSDKSNRSRRRPTNL